MTAGALVGQVALVTGGGRGIGRAVAWALAGAGADVAVGYHSRVEDAKETAGNIRSAGRRAIVAPGDVGSRDEVAGLVARVVEEFGRLDILVNSAGVIQRKPLPEITEDDWNHVLDTNLKGTFLCSQAVLPVMAQRASGRIINLASSGGQLGGPLAPHYSASKAGVIALTKSFARLAAPGVLVNCISPGLIETEMTRDEINSDAGQQKLGQVLLGRVGSPAEVAEVALFLASSAGYMTGQTLNVNGGLYLG